MYSLQPLKCERWAQSISGPCTKLEQYKEIQNVRIWLQCLAALSGRHEDELLLELHKEFFDLNTVSFISLYYTYNLLNPGVYNDFWVV